MEETFYGPWTITVSGHGSRVRAILTGTDSVDGVYTVAAQPYVVEATGEVWKVRGERMQLGSSAWETFDVARSSAFDPARGLTMQLVYNYLGVTPAEPGFTPLVSRNRIVLDCVSRDPALAPVPAPAPPDFTAPDVTPPRIGG
jgi:hypothetical protein